MCCMPFWHAKKHGSSYYNAESSIIRSWISCIHGGEPKIGEKRQLKREPFNKEDVSAVAVVREKAA